MTKFETFLGKNNEHYFRLINDKGEILLSSEGYIQKDGLLNGIASVKKNIVVPELYELKTAANGKHFFNLKAKNGQVISKSAMWDSKELLDTYMQTMKTEVPAADVIESNK
ncbi:MAG: YegP family protein [Bacteroidota bacterium]|nr:YegP family protein [Bacteroidota bacterium]